MRFSISSVAAKAALAGIAGTIVVAMAVQAQERPPGTADSACARDCAGLGHSVEYCGRVCWIPERPRSAPEEVTDWSCMTVCADRGGKYAECKPACRLR